MAPKARTTKTTQVTREGAEIPIPKRGDFFGNLKKAATADVSLRDRDKLLATSRERIARGLKRRGPKK